MPKFSKTFVMGQASGAIMANKSAALHHVVCGVNYAIANLTIPEAVTATRRYFAEPISVWFIRVVVHGFALLISASRGCPGPEAGVIFIFSLVE